MSKNKITQIKKLQPGLAIYKTGNSKNWFARILIPKTKKYIRKSTKETSRVTAAEVAYEIMSDFRINQRRYTHHNSVTSFKTYADKLIRQQSTLVGSERSDRFLVDDLKLLERQEDGLNAFFGTKEITDITTPLMREYFNLLDKNRVAPLAASTKTKHGIVIRKVLMIAVEEKVIPSIPLIPKFSIKNNPRVTFKEEEYKKFIQGIKRLALKGDVIRGNRLTDEFYYFSLIIVHSFLRPIKTEAFGLKHHHIEIKHNPPHIQLDVDGKTGRRRSVSTTFGVEIYQKLKNCNPDFNSPDDFIFLPKMKNRETAVRIGQRFFNHVVEQENIKFDKDGNPRSLYSLRHYALQIRMIKSGGEINIFDLAKNAGTSVNQLEKFYLKFMERSPAQIKNLQIFASDV